MIKDVRKLLEPDPSFRSQLGDRRWDDRRRAYLRTVGGYCQSCKRGDVPLQVHHIAYDTGKNLWDYDDTQLRAMCEPCHKAWHDANSFFRREIGARMPANELKSLVLYLRCLIDAHQERFAVPSMLRGLACDRVLAAHAKLKGGLNGQE